MNRTETSILKGVAILMMVFHHLFNRIDNVALCADVALWGEQSMLNWLSNACNPVAFFVVLGGYGMYIVSQRGDKNRYSRIVKLFVHLWFIMGVFILIGSCLFPEIYPGNIWNLILNLLSYRADYNHEYWFLFPYVILMLNSRFLFKLADKCKSWVVVLVSFVLTMIASTIISRYKLIYLIDHNWLLQLVRYFNFLFAFMLGGMSAREHWIEHFRTLFTPRWIAWILLSVLFLVRCCVDTSIVNVPYAFLFIILFIAAPRPLWLDKILDSFGRLSMDIWFIHTWLCYYLFHDFFYSLHHPILIFAAVTACSYAVAFVVSKVLDPILNKSIKTTSKTKANEI